MKLCVPDIKCSGRRRRGFSLVEVVVAMGLFAVSLVAVLSGIPAIIMKAQFSQEQAQATQIMLEKMEQLRMTPWGALTNLGTIHFQVSDSDPVSDPLWEANTVQIRTQDATMSEAEKKAYYDSLNLDDNTVALDSGAGTLDNTLSNGETAPTDSDTSPTPPTEPERVYYGAVVIENNPVQEAYRGSLTRIKIKVQWTSRYNQTNETELVSYVSQHGVQSADNL